MTVFMEFKFDLMAAEVPFAHCGCSDHAYWHCGVFFSPAKISFFRRALIFGNPFFIPKRFIAIPANWIQRFPNNLSLPFAPFSGALFLFFRVRKFQANWRVVSAAWGIEMQSIEKSQLPRKVPFECPCCKVVKQDHMTQTRDRRF